MISKLPPSYTTTRIAIRVHRAADLQRPETASMPTTRSSQTVGPAPAPENAGSDERMTVAKALFADVFHGSVNTVVDPRACIPLTQIRRVSTSGVLRLKRIFKGKHGDPGLVGNAGESIGFVAGTDCPLILPLEGAYRKYIAQYFRTDKGMTDAEAQEEADAREEWYGVVDGVHRLLALLQLMDEDPERWEGFLWPVTVLKSGCSFQVLKQLARHQNIKQSQQQYVETTLYDQLHGLKKEAERLSRERINRKKPTAREIANAFDGSGGFMDTTIQQMATAALRLPDVVLETLGAIMNAEHPELVEVSISTRRNSPALDRTEVMSTVDCRVFRRFLNITSIKQATSFMKSEGDHGTETQVNTLYRCKEICRRNGFKPVSFKGVTEQYRKATLAMKEVLKFEDLLESTTWPKEMEVMRRNILQTTKFDEEIDRNVGNDTVVLQSIVSKYKAICPAKCTAKIQKYRATHQNLKEKYGDPVQNPEMNDEHVLITGTWSDQPPAGIVRKPVEEALPGGQVKVLAPQKDDNHNIARSTEHSPGEDPVPNGTPTEGIGPSRRDVPNGNPTVAISPNRRDSQCDNGSDIVALASGTRTEASERLRTALGGEENGLELLHSLHIQCHQMKWQEYDKTILSQEDSIFDLVLTDPPYGVEPNPSKAGTKYKNYVEEQEMKEFAEFCRRVLVPGGYVFLFTSAKYFYTWLQAFRDAGLKPCEYPFIMNKNGSSMQGTRLEDFPQCAAELSLMARAPGKSSSSFKPNFTSPYHLFDGNSQKRRYASLINAPIPKHKLTNGKSRAPILTEEKNADVLGEIIITFCPDGGRVLDCYGGTFTTAVAALKTSRKCVCIEMNADIFRPAFSRLARLAPEFASKCKAQKTVGASAEKQRARKSNAGSITRQNQDATVGNTELITAVAEYSSDAERSTAAQASTETERSTEIVGGDQVILLQDGFEVGFATVQAKGGAPGGALQRRIHGSDLEGAGKSDEDLIVILRVSIKPGMQKLPYKYSFPTQDDLPQKLSELLQNGVYVWDLKKLKPLQNASQTLTVPRRGTASSGVFQDTGSAHAAKTSG